jgi:cholesterol transport system auxiliary component
MRVICGRAATALTLLALGGCALLGKADALSPRYFSPELSGSGGVSARSSTTLRGAAIGELRLGRITAASHLRERIVFRDSKYELNFYEGRRWSEKPEAFLRRALAKSLFEERGLRRIISGSGPTLEVELTEFAEMKRSPPVARVAATYVLFDDRAVRREASLAMELPIAGGKDAAEALVGTLSQTLNQMVERIVHQVVGALPPVPGDPTRGLAPDSHGAEGRDDGLSRSGTSAGSGGQKSGE